jgi:hypothetical protein
VRRPGRWLAAALVGAGIVLLGVAIGRSGSSDATSSSPRPLARAVAVATPARKPFAELTTMRVSVGGHRMKVVVADDADERTAGLRQRSDIGSYDGMLFAFDEPTTTAFTMSTVPVALDIGFYDAAGRVVDRLRMEPCAGSEAECPIYQASAPFVYALETLGDGLPHGRLRAVTPPS